MLSAAEQGGFNPYRAEFVTVSVDLGEGETANVPWQGGIICGHNPWLAARKVRVWALGDGSGRVGWEDDKRPGMSQG